MFPPLLTVFPDVNFPVVDLLDHVIVDELVNDSDNHIEGSSSERYSQGHRQYDT
jgi:hypothetical protein